MSNQWDNWRYVFIYKYNIKHTSCFSVETNCFTRETSCFTVETSCFTVDASCFSVETNCFTRETSCFTVETSCFTEETTCFTVETSCSKRETSCLTAEKTCRNKTRAAAVFRRVETASAPAHHDKCSPDERHIQLFGGVPCDLRLRSLGGACSPDNAILGRRPQLP